MFDIRSGLSRFLSAKRDQAKPKTAIDHGYMDDGTALQAHALVSITDPAGLLCSVNNRFSATLGYHESDLIGISPLDLYHSKDREHFPEILAMLENGIMWSGDMRLMHKNGQIVWTQATIMPRIHIDGTMIGAIAVRTDITAQRAATTMRGTVSTLHHLSEPVYMISADTMQVAYANAAAVELFGWNKLNLSDMTAMDIDLICDHADIADKIGQLRRGEKTRVNFNAEKNGASYHATVQMITPGVGGARFFVMLRHCSDELALTRAKESFVSTVSHELRTPLTSIKGALGLVLSGAAGEMTGRSRNLLEIAHRNADRLVLIVNDILDLEKLSAGKMDYDMQLRDLRTAIADARAAIQTYADEFSVTIRDDTEDCDTVTPAVAKYDASRIHQVLTNLLSNACKFSKPGGEILISVAQKDGFHSVSVTDRGQGIPEDALETIFERFTQVASSQRSKLGGTGLGLSIVKAIVESHGGDVTLHSTQGTGTTVTFTLENAEHVQSAIGEIA